jgi:hypothetical protein
VLQRIFELSRGLPEELEADCGQDAQLDGIVRVFWKPATSHEEACFWCGFDAALDFFNDVRNCHRMFLGP